MKRFIFGAVIATLMGLCRQAQAQSIIIPSTGVVFNGYTNGIQTSALQLDITYDVTLTGSLYEYDYTLTTVPSENLFSFSLGGNPDPIDTVGLNIINYGGAIPAASGTNSVSVAWAWGPINPVTSATVSFTSPIAPQFATFTVNDDDILWMAPPGIPAPVPTLAVPEPSTYALLSAAVFIFGLVRYRRAARQNAKKPAPIKVTSRISR